MKDENYRKVRHHCYYTGVYRGAAHYRKVRHHCYYTGVYRGAAHSISNLKYSVSKKISIVFRNVLNYDYHLIIKELAEEFKNN